MKKFLILNFLIIISGFSFAQNYLISFSGSGQSSTADIIEVLNLTQQTSLTLNGSDILNLVGVVGLSEEISKEDRLKIYPNPMYQSARIEFENPVSGLTTILVIDNNGRIILEYAEILTKKYQIFTISGLPAGHYALQIINGEMRYVAQLISTGTQNGLPYIKYEGSVLNGGPGKNFKNDRDLVEMQYNEGDWLYLKGISSNYARIITIVPTESQQVEFDFIECVDFDNNSYPVVTIGTQTWMAENLMTTHYRNGEEIPNVTVNTDWSGITTGAYCWYDNEISWKDAYGALYNWYAVNDSRELCPIGWHVPTDAEWATLINFLGGDVSAGGKNKSTRTEPYDHPRWDLPNTAASNESGFSGLPGGYRESNSPFKNLGGTGRFWSSIEQGSGAAWGRSLNVGSSYMTRIDMSKKTGFSVRCLRD